MQFSNHLLLGRALAKTSPVLAAHPLRRTCFLLGNILPDLIPFTYWSGTSAPRRMIGHNLPYSQPKITRKLKKGLSVGLYSAADAFRLGLLMHYLADAFTFPHTVGFSGTRKTHSAYERALKAVFPQYLSLIEKSQPATSARFLLDAKQQYECLDPTPARDAEWIVRTCASVFYAIVSV